MLQSLAASMDKARTSEASSARKYFSTSMEIHNRISAVTSFIGTKLEDGFSKAKFSEIMKDVDIMLDKLAAEEYIPSTSKPAIRESVRHHLSLLDSGEEKMFKNFTKQITKLTVSDDVHPQYRVYIDKCKQQNDIAAQESFDTSEQLARDVFRLYISDISKLLG